MRLPRRRASDANLENVPELAKGRDQNAGDRYPSARGTQGIRAISIPSSANASASAGDASP